MNDPTNASPQAIEKAAEIFPDAAVHWNQALLDTLLADDDRPEPRREQGSVTRASRAAAIQRTLAQDDLETADATIGC